VPVASSPQSSAISLRFALVLLLMNMGRSFLNVFNTKY
jgi:hypothetical protein